MHKSDSIEMKKSILTEYGIRVKSSSVELVTDQIFLIAKNELTTKLTEQFTITDLIDPDKTGLIFDLYLDYYELTCQYGSYHVWKGSFLSHDNTLSNQFISRNRDWFKTMFSDHIDNDISNKDLRKIPDAYIYYLASRVLNNINIRRNSYLVNSQNEGPFKNYIKEGWTLRENIPIRNLAYLWNQLQETNLLTEEERIIAYKKMILGIRSSYTWITNPLERKRDMYENLLHLVRDVEFNLFHKTENEINIIIGLIPYE